MTIQQIYRKYTIPPNLQRHQIEVAAVGQFVTEHWTGPPIDRELIVQELLLHDMGNIVKFRRPFMGELEKRAADWEKVQDKMRTQYGMNAHAATMAILKEIMVGASLLRLVEEQRLIADGKRGTPSYEARIADFADTCVTPQGIVGFETRMEDLKKRYELTEDSASVVAWRENARIVQEHVDRDLRAIQNMNFHKRIAVLRQHAIPIQNEKTP